MISGGCDEEGQGLKSREEVENKKGGVRIGVVRDGRGKRECGD